MSKVSMQPPRGRRGVRNRAGHNACPRPRCRTPMAPRLSARTKPTPSCLTLRQAQDRLVPASTGRLWPSRRVDPGLRRDEGGRHIPNVLASREAARQSSPHTTQHHSAVDDPLRLTPPPDEAPSLASARTSRSTVGCWSRPNGATVFILTQRPRLRSRSCPGARPIGRNKAPVLPAFTAARQTPHRPNPSPRPGCAHCWWRSQYIAALRPCR